MVKTKKTYKTRLRKTEKQGGKGKSNKTNNVTLTMLENTELLLPNHQKIIEIQQTLIAVSFIELNKKNMTRIKDIAEKFIASSDNLIKNAATTILINIEKFNREEEKKAIKLVQKARKEEQIALEKSRKEEEKQRLAAEEKEKQRVSAEEKEKQRLVIKEKQRIAEEKQRVAAEEKQRVAAEEKEKLAIKEKQKLAIKEEKEKQKLAIKEEKEKERLAAEEKEKERLAAEEKEKERLAAEEKEKERLVAEKEKERLAEDARKAAIVETSKTLSPKVSSKTLSPTVSSKTLSPTVSSKYQSITTLNDLSRLLTDSDIELLLSKDLLTQFSTNTGKYLDFFDKFRMLDPYTFSKIYHIETIILVLTGIINMQTKEYKIILKGGKGLQMEFRRQKHTMRIVTDDIDLLIHPIGEYNEAEAKKVAHEFAQIVLAIINQIYVSGEFSILPEEKSINKYIVKMSYLSPEGYKAISDVDFKKDTQDFFTDEKLSETRFYLKNKNTKTNLLYYHQSLDAFINEKKEIKQNYDNCDCTKKDLTEGCKQLCKDKDWMLVKLSKYKPVIQSYELSQKIKQHKINPAAVEFVPGKGLEKTE
jgi:chemotaxis protein histidine kinase CheA